MGLTIHILHQNTYHRVPTDHLSHVYVAVAEVPVVLLLTLLGSEEELAVLLEALMVVLLEALMVVLLDYLSDWVSD